MIQVLIVMLTSPSRIAECFVDALIKVSRQKRSLGGHSLHVAMVTNHSNQPEMDATTCRRILEGQPTDTLLTTRYGEYLRHGMENTTAISHERNHCNYQRYYFRYLLNIGCKTLVAKGKVWVNFMCCRLYNISILMLSSPKMLYWAQHWAVAIHRFCYPIHSTQKTTKTTKSEIRI